MKKNNLTKLALLGILSGLFTVSQSPLYALDSDQNSNGSTTSDPNSENVDYHLLSEKELLSLLNENGKKIYMSLDEEGKKLAREVASQRCNGTNKCKGLNACMTDHNDCAGKGSCEGKGKCAFPDKNLAVKLVSEKMKEKREKAGSK